MFSAERDGIFAHINQGFNAICTTLEKQLSKCSNEIHIQLRVAVFEDGIRDEAAFPPTEERGIAGTA